ncbi:MAG: hypothetical protein F4069_09175 [Rhodothermaceae bacterium]|nr:hypothetical protein [Rhodothermaceae bacterium]MYG70543.1 hypothetical protein [Rhodothermaceae bacterium]MYJ45478.1 hypothetical protein [Rhodothermaceae bacterium]
MKFRKGGLPLNRREVKKRLCNRVACRRSDGLCQIADQRHSKQHQIWTGSMSIMSIFVTLAMYGFVA